MIPGLGAGTSLQVSDTTNQALTNDIANRAGGAGSRGFTFGHVGGIGTSGAVGSGSVATWLPWVFAAAGLGVAIWLWFRNR